MTIDRDHFYDSVRESLFGGNLSQDQVDGINYLLDVWEREPLFGPGNPNDGDMWLAYAFATVYHETAQTMRPIEEYGQGQGHSYGEPTGPHNQCYYGRGHVQLTWEENYKKAEDILKNKYGLDCSLHPEPHRMLEDEPSALVLFDGMIYGWFTGVSLQDYFSKAKGIEDPYNARRIINGTDKASILADYYWKFKEAII